MTLQVKQIFIFSGARNEEGHSCSDDEGSLFNDGASVTKYIYNQSQAFILNIDQSQVTSEASSFAPDTDPEAVDESSKVRVSVDQSEASIQAT